MLLSSSSTLKAARAYFSCRASVPFWLGQENSDSQTGRPYLEYTSFKYLHSGSAQPAGVSWWRYRLKSQGKWQASVCCCMPAAQLVTPCMHFVHGTSLCLCTERGRGKCKHFTIKLTSFGAFTLTELAKQDVPLGL